MSVRRTLGAVTLVVRNYDEAMDFFTTALRFRLVEDVPLGNGKRWVLVAPSLSGASLLLAKAATPDQERFIGAQTGGRVAFFLHTDDFWRDYQHMLAYGVRFAEEPRGEEYGLVVVFYDLYGNKWDLVQKDGPMMC